MKILVATDAWHPQVNGVVHTLLMMSRGDQGAAASRWCFSRHSHSAPLPCPAIRDIRLAMPRPARIARLIEASKPDAIHIATEGPIGMLVRRYCRARGLDVIVELSHALSGICLGAPAGARGVGLGDAATISQPLEFGDGGDAAAGARN